MNIKIEKRTQAVVAILCLIISISGFVLTSISYKEGYSAGVADSAIDIPVYDPGILHTDPAVRTGYLSTEKYTAIFDTTDFPVAGSDDSLTICRISVWKYPAVPGIDDPVEYITGSFDSAVEYLELLQSVK